MASKCMKKCSVPVFSRERKSERSAMPLQCEMEPPRTHKQPCWLAGSREKPSPLPCRRSQTSTSARGRSVERPQKTELEMHLTQLYLSRVFSPKVKVFVL